MRKNIWKSALGLALAFTTVFAGMGAAHATTETTHWGYANLGTDCTVYAKLAANNVTALGEVLCNHRHVNTYVQTTLKITEGAAVLTSTTGWIGPFTNSYGTGSFYASAAFVCNRNYQYQAVVSGWVDGVQTYATSGAPAALC